MPPSEYMMRFTLKIWANPPFMMQHHHNQQDEDENSQHREDRVPNRKSPVYLIGVWKVGRCGLYLHFIFLKSNQNKTNKNTHTKEFSCISFNSLESA